MRIKKIFIKIINFGEMKHLLANVSWLAVDRVVRLGINLFIVGWIARYLGREQYGLMNYAMSLTMLIGALASFGTNSIIIRELVKHPEKRDEILGSSFVIRQVGGFVVVVVSLATAMLINRGDSLTQLLVVISSITYAFASLDIIDLYFQSKIKSKYAVIANNSVFILLSAIRIILIIIKAPVTAFVIAATAEVFVAQMALIAMYQVTGHSVFKWRWDTAVAREMLRDSWPLMLSVVSVLFYMRIGQVMLGKMASYTELGDYSAAVKISEVWYFVPIVVSTTIYPKLIECRKHNVALYYKRMQEYFSILAFISYAAVIPTFFFNNLIIKIIFGDKFINAGSILSLHIWAGLFVGMGNGRNNWCNIENYTRGTFYSTLAGAIINVLLNIPLIKMYGGMGAAAGTMIARIVAGYLSTIFMSKRIFVMQTKAYFLVGLYSLAKQIIASAKNAPPGDGAAV
jgi:polysaccharide transporter, PST family